MRRVNPGVDAVLARLTGGPLMQTGVFEGMSGSPVFIDGKLLGAVAFAFPFAKEAIAGITPITQMVDAFTERLDPEGPGKLIMKKSALWQYRSPVPEGTRPDRLPLNSSVPEARPESQLQQRRVAAKCPVWLSREGNRGNRRPLVDITHLYRKPGSPPGSPGLTATRNILQVIST